MAALILVYIYAGEAIWLDNQVNKVVTYILLVVGFLVEVAYVIRLLFSKGAVVAMVVTLVRTQRAAQRCPSWAARKLYIMKVTISRLACVGALRINMFMDPSYRNINRQYLPRSVALSWLHQLLKAVSLGYSVSHSQRGWDMFCMTLPEGCDREREIQQVQACQTDALQDIFELVSLVTRATSREEPFVRAPSCMPGHSPLICCNNFLPFYNHAWENVLVTWVTATLKLLCLERWTLEVVTSEPLDDVGGVDSAPVEPVGDVGGVDSEPVDPVSATVPSAMGNGTSSQEVESTHEVRSISARNKPSTDSSASNVQLEKIRYKAVWGMLYVCRLLTGIPELLPTQLDLTKELMTREFVQAELDIKGMKKDMKSWVDEVRQEVMGWLPPEPVTFSNIIGITGRPQDMVGFSYPHHNRDNQLEFRPADVYTCARASKYVAMMLFGMDPGSRWEVVASSAFWFIAALAQSNKAGQHCRQLTKGGELLTILWILSSHLGGGVH
jgi:hypothetical protein